MNEVITDTSYESYEAWIHTSSKLGKTTRRYEHGSLRSEHQDCTGPRVRLAFQHGKRAQRRHVAESGGDKMKTKAT